MSKIWFDDANGVAFDIIANDLLPVWWMEVYRITGIFCGCLIFAEFCGSIQIAEIKIAKYSNPVTMIKSCPK